MIDFAFAREVLPLLLSALKVSVAATAGGMVVALLLGLVVALARRSGPRWLALSASGWVEFVRSTPLLIQLYFAFYVLQDALGIQLSALLTGTLVLGIHYASYVAEIYRSGIEGVAKGQWEAARALDLSPWQTYRHVILPQAIPPLLPALGNRLIAMFKETPLLSAITVVELLQQAKLIGSERFRYLEPLTLVGLLFLVLSLTAGAGVRWLERRLEARYA